MLKFIDLKCPAMVNLYCNRDNGNLLSVYDNIELFDEVELSISVKYTASKVYLNNVLMIGDNLILKAIKAFFDYTNLPVNGVIVKIQKNVPEQLDFKNLECVTAGVILALNTYYQLDLKEEQLIEIALMVSSTLPLYMYGGYQMFKDNERLCQLVDNRSDNYLIVLGKSKDKWFVNETNDLIINNQDYNGQFFNYLEGMAPDELLDLKEMLLRLKADKVSINGTSNSLVAYFSSRHERFMAREELKEQKIKTLVCKPVDGIKVSRRYK